MSPKYMLRNKHDVPALPPCNTILVKLTNKLVLLTLIVTHHDRVSYYSNAFYKIHDLAMWSTKHQATVKTEREKQECTANIINKACGWHRNQNGCHMHIY